MARVAITEYAAKKLLFGDSYQGVSVTPADFSVRCQALPRGTYIVKVDVGIKKRGKKGLIRATIDSANVKAAVSELFALGYERCLIEPMIDHHSSAERYLSLELCREGVVLLHSEQGGVEIESAPPQSIARHIIDRMAAFNAQPEIDIPGVPLPQILENMQAHHLSFLEINPYIVTEAGFQALDLAIEIDTAKETLLPDWIEPHILHKRAISTHEQRVLEQDARTQAALNLHTLNENGSILTLFSGGGASLVALDALVAAGLQSEVINYSEYSGAPTRDETEEYVATLLEVLAASPASSKVIVIAGGVANFTDVMATFQGIVDAFSRHLTQLQSQNVAVCVRRGGPNQEAGLAYLRAFLVKHQLPHAVHDPTLSLGEIGTLVKKFL